jgi:hypothetical protein
MKGENGVISITDKGKGQAGETSLVAGKDVRVTVTGLDEKGQMYRESAPVIELSGRECHFRSKFQPDLGSWVLVEFDSPNAGAKRTALQGQVKSTQSEGLAGTLFRIHIELESAPGLTVVADPQAARTAAPALQPPAVAAPKAEVIRAPKEVVAEAVTRPKPEANTGIFLSVEVPQSKAASVELPPNKPAAPTIRELPAPRERAETTGSSAVATTAAVALEVNQQLALLKGSLNEELERIAQRTISSSLEPMIRETVEKQIAANYQTAIQTLNSDLTYQLAGRLSGSAEFRDSISGMAKKALDEQMGAARSAMLEEQRKASANLAEIRQTVEKSVSEIEVKLKVTGGAAISTLERAQALQREVEESIARLQTEKVKAKVDLADIESRMQITDGAATATLERAQALEREVAESTDRLQKAVDQLNQAVRTTIEKFDGHVTSQLNTWSAQFKTHVEVVSREKSAQFTTVLQQQLLSQVQEANEAVEKLSAGLQLARGSLRVQETQWAERSREIAAEFEKEIKSALLRLAGAI